MERTIHGYRSGKDGVHEAVFADGCFVDTPRGRALVTAEISFNSDYRHGTVFASLDYENANLATREAPLHAIPALRQLFRNDGIY